ncbi:hypothetical protein BH09PAT4_BH09PAT4_05270 [soil metagenome]
MVGAETVQSNMTNEIVTSREQFYVNVDLYKDPKSCGDDRESDLNKFIHMFGGVLFIAYTRGVLQEVSNPGSTDSVPNLTTQTLSELQGRGVESLSVHSDSAAEDGSTIDLTERNGSVGCGYAAKRAAISQLIYENGEQITNEASQLLPELFIDESAWSFARATTEAHGRLAQRASDAIGDGRALVLTALEKGAQGVLVHGEHTATEGIINTRRNTSLLTNDAVRAGLPVYQHDLWASSELLAMLQDAPDRQQAALASVIDIIGTMKALGVQEIGVR